MSDRVSYGSASSDTNSDSSDETFDPELASDSEKFSDDDFDVIDADELNDIDNINLTDVLKSPDGTQYYTQDSRVQPTSTRGM